MYSSWTYHQPTVSILRCHSWWCHTVWMLWARAIGDKMPIFWEGVQSSRYKAKAIFFLTNHGLSRSHKYYTQVQGQLGVCEKAFCDFVVWTPKGISIERIYRDLPFWEKVLKKLTTFYVQHLLPELMTHNIMSPEIHDEKENLYCFCQKEEYGTMIKCDNPTCKYEWFHYACVKLTRKPKGSWYCQDCCQVNCKQ